MQVPTREALLQQLDSLTHGARMARVAAPGKEARGTAALTRLMDELLAGDAYEAGLALQLARAAARRGPPAARPHPPLADDPRPGRLAGGPLHPG